MCQEKKEEKKEEKKAVQVGLLSLPSKPCEVSAAQVKELRGRSGDFLATVVSEWLLIF